MARAAKSTGAKLAPKVNEIPLDLPPMEARSVEDLPSEGEWQYEPKWDGFRCIAHKSPDMVELRAKSGKPLGRYFPEVVTLLRELPFDRFVVDGELVIEIEGHLSFDALQMRLHPAESRIHKLSVATPARFIMFDILLTPDGKQLIDEPLTRRREALESFSKKTSVAGRLMLSPATRNREQAVGWLRDSGEATDGVVAKKLDRLYEPGERAMVKVKRLRTADCVVGGFRYESNSREVGSLLLGLYDQDGKLNHVGFTSTITDKERASLTNPPTRSAS
jgi:ATP-dependent DNA ligase